jgi:hypothetical protein
LAVRAKWQKFEVIYVATIGSFGNVRTAGAYIDLLIAYLRAKPYTDCRGYRKYCNGSPGWNWQGCNYPPETG